MPLVGFDFPEYLHRNINYVVLEIMEVSPSSWGLVAFLAVANFIRAVWLAGGPPSSDHASAFVPLWFHAYGLALRTPAQELAAFATVGWLLLGAQRLLLRKARGASARLYANAICSAKNAANRRHAASPEEDGSDVGPEGALTKALEMLELELAAITADEDDAASFGDGKGVDDDADEDDDDRGGVAGNDAGGGDGHYSGVADGDESAALSTSRGILRGRRWSSEPAAVVVPRPSATALGPPRPHSQAC